VDNKKIAFVVHKFLRPSSPGFEQLGHHCDKVSGAEYSTVKNLLQFSRCINADVCFTSTEKVDKQLLLELT